MTNEPPERNLECAVSSDLRRAPFGHTSMFEGGCCQARDGANRMGLFRLTRPRLTCPLTRRSHARQHDRVDGWNRGNRVQPCLTAKGTKHENERAQRRSIAIFEVPQRAHTDACTCRHSSLVQVLVHAMRLQVAPDFGFQLSGRPCPPGAIRSFHLPNPRWPETCTQQPEILCLIQGTTRSRGEILPITSVMKRTRTSPDGYHFSTFVPRRRL
ncbi:hypothetical protein PMI06_003089 [Burkholderia sp. BT03]|nr:hypothetical protein PMI06_003089 [Burkholderia sp. BT03]SKC62270.1 hypothetical protein SAMN06266956_1251 [Paraburkholderia hospita]